MPHGRTWTVNMTQLQHPSSPKFARFNQRHPEPPEHTRIIYRWGEKHKYKPRLWALLAKPPLQASSAMRWVSGHGCGRCHFVTSVRKHLHPARNSSWNHPNFPKPAVRGEEAPGHARSGFEHISNETKNWDEATGGVWVRRPLSIHAEQAERPSLPGYVIHASI